ncbi:uncharacterized protein LOC117124164 [Anneissia japonica]|uniref:uncharacterized protein LOC117124164 n=1 Tax=Anneissia japonica TaxID=1529436 RepID=UPI00142550C2|nr:uncharacterized protein LOC117124164 [Anneissia japonica]
MSAKKKISNNAVAMTDIASVPVRFPNKTQKQMKSADILRKPQPITDKRIKPTCDQFVLDPHPTGAELKMCNLFRHPKINHDDFLVLHVHVDFPGKNLFEFLSNGLLVSQRPYRGKPKRYIFFGHSASQLRNRTCFLYDEKLGDFNDIIQMFGDFSCINNVAKRAARIGLLLSTANEVLQLRDDDITKETDIERDGYNFTDGCGSISVECATRITEAMGQTELYKHQVPPVPSVFQIRLKGCKGVLVVDPKLPRGIKIRNSLEKFSWKLSEPHILGVVDDGISKPYAYGNLIKHFIRILSALGVPDKAFLKLQTSFFEELHQLEKDKWIAIKHLYISGRSDLAERVISMTYDYCSNQEIREKLESIRRKVFDDRKTGASDKLERTKKSKAEGLNIRAELSRNVFGVCDNSNTLEEGTVFFQPTIRGKPVVIKGRVIVAKSPSYYPGDIRVLTCVDNKHCRHLVDCVVYPVKGKRPHCDEIAGSDLDGDKYFICWDPDLVPKQHWKPTSYQGGKSKTQSNITTDDLIRYFAYYDVRLVGKFSNLLEMWADIAGIDSPQCMALANLFNHAIDAAKTGENVKVPKSLMVKSRKGEKMFVCEKMVNNAKCLSGDIKESVPKIEKEMREEYGEESEEYSTFVDAASLVYKASYTAPLDDIDVNNHDLALRRSRSGIVRLLMLRHDLEIREETTVLSNEIMDASEETISSLLQKNNWPADDFKLFRMLYKWCQRHEKMNLLSRFCQLIDFSTFTRLQRELAMVDCPDSIEQIQGRHSGLQSSSILSAEDVANLNSEISPTKWSLVYTVLNQDEEIFSWEDILSKMSDDLLKLLVCKFDLGGTWVITIFVPGALELLQTSNDTTTLPDLRAFVSVHGFNSQNCIVNKENVVHAVLLRRSRLQIYPADQSTRNTFICMMEEDGRTKMSVALQNFSSGFKRRYPDIYLRREPIISCEIFLGFSDVRQLPTYFVTDTDPPELNPEIEPPECPDFLYRQEEFPVVSSSREAHTEHSRTWFQEVDNKYNELKMLAANGTLLNSQLQMLFAMANGDSEIVFSTCIGAGTNYMTEQYFPHVLLDEASQATEPAAMVPLQYGCQRLCLVGDDKQLPPLVKSSNADQLEVSIFERLRQTFPTHLLNIQYRMHPTLAAFPSLKFYENQLLNGVDAKDRPLPCGFPHNKGKPLLFLDTSMIKSREKSAGESKLNREEANEIKILVEQLLKAKDVNETEIGIISPYTAQVRLLKELLKKPKIDVRTVDGFQGQEREVIIFSAVRSNDDKLVGFLDNERRFNVLLTRARRGMIVVGNSTTLRSSALWREWIDWTERNACKAHVNRTDGQVTGPRSSQGRDRENEHASQDAARNYSGARSRDGRRGMGRGGRGRGGSSRGGSSKGGRGMVQNWERW